VDDLAGRDSVDLANGPNPQTKGSKMSNLTGNIGHIITAVLVTVAVTILAITNHITGSQAVVVIVGVGGFSLGGSVASSPGSTTPPAPPAA
jgi:hypothetical protein